MKIAYLILAHSNPQHLRRLISKLTTGNAMVFVHFDNKSDIGAFENLGSERVIFIKDRVPVYWGDFSQVEAILTLLNAALDSAFDIDRLVLLSGVDYPVKPMHEIESFLDTHQDVEFITVEPMTEDSATKPTSRMDNFVVRPSKFWIKNFSKRVLRRIGIVPRMRQRDHRTYLQELVPFGGSQWWAITREAGEYIQQFIRNRKELVKFFENVQVPDESFVHTILMNSKFKGQIRPSFTYADWSAGGGSPAMLDMKHLPLLIGNFSRASNANEDVPVLFARKFMDGQDELLDQIDKQQLPEER